MPLRYLKFIKEEGYKDHAWGLVLLSNMHHFLNMREADLKKQKAKQSISNVCGYLLMVFFFENLPDLRDAFFRDRYKNEAIFSKDDASTY